MYPFDQGGRTRRQFRRWILAGRHLHLIEALEANPERFVGERGWTLRRRVRGLRHWGRIRAVVLFFLYFGILATVVAWVFRYLPSSEPVREIVDQLTALSSAFTGLLTLAALFFTRLMGQIEMDILMLINIDSKKHD